MIETKVTLQTTEAEGHVHERFFAEGTIPAGTYKTSETNDHSHFFVISESLQPGESVTVRTSPPDGEDEGHQHSITVRAVSGETDSGDTEEDRMKPGHKNSSPSIEIKRMGGRVLETKEITVNGVRVGVIDGYIATWSPDTGGRFGVPDQFVQGAFTESLQEHRERDNRQIRLKDMHGRVIGGFPIETAFEDSVGLRAEGHINLETQLGREAWALIKQGVLTDLSIGFSALDDKIENGLRMIFKAIVWEGSVVDEPANRDAQILEVKSIMPFQDLPLADRGTAWDPKDLAAMGAEQKNAFVWHDRTDPDAPESYRLRIADRIDGHLVAVPKAIFAAAAELKRDDGSIPDAARAKAVCHLERYYAKMGLESPFEREERRFMGVDEVKDLDAAGLVEALRQGVTFSKGAAKLVAARNPAGNSEEKRYGSQVSDMLNVLDECKSLLRKGRVLRT